MPDICPECGQIKRQTHKETLSKQKLTMLKQAASEVQKTMKNDISQSIFSEDANAYTNFQKLRYHGLIYYMSNHQGQRVRGHWLITRNGWSFLRGEIDLPKYVLVKNNHIEGRSDALVSVRDVHYGSEVIQTTFEYFDDDGKPVGFHPQQPAAPQQSSLFNQIGQRM